jgi:hypothetical protein
MSYPKDLKMFVNKLSGYSRNTLKITPYRTNSISGGDIITIDFPNSSMLDLNTLTFHFKGTTTTSVGFAAFPRNIEGIISKLIVEINGQTLNSCQSLSDLYQIMYNLSQGADFKQKRALYQNSTGGAVVTKNTTKEPFKIQHFLGFLGSVKPEVLDTALLGAVRLHITLENPNVLIGGASLAHDAPSGAGYTLDDLYFTVDVVSIDDGVYYSAKNSYLANGGIFEMPYDNWYSSLFSTGGTYQQSARFSVATQSLDFLCATFPKHRSFGESNIPAIQNSQYFQYDASGVYDYQFLINNVAIPQYRPKLDDAFALTLNALNLTQDTQGGIDGLITTRDVWNENFWVASARLNDTSEPSERFISGISTSGTNAQIEFNTSADPNNGTQTCSNCLLFAKTSSILRVGAGKSLEIVS